MFYNIVVFGKISSQLLQGTREQFSAPHDWWGVPVEPYVINIVLPYKMVGLSQDLTIQGLGLGLLLHHGFCIKDRVTMVGEHGFGMLSHLAE